MTEVFWTVIAILLSAILLALCGFFYKRFTYNGICELKFWREARQGTLSSEISSNYQDNITKRIMNYNKLIIAFLVVTLVVVLLILKVILAESGLPIITAVAGYVLADSQTVRNVINDPNKDKTNKSEKE